jgi:hypothetical protein
MQKRKVRVAFERASWDNRQTYKTGIVTTNAPRAVGGVFSNREAPPTARFALSGQPGDRRQIASPHLAPGASSRRANAQTPVPRTRTSPSRPCNPNTHSQRNGRRTTQRPVRLVLLVLLPLRTQLAPRSSRLATHVMQRHEQSQEKSKGANANPGALGLLPITRRASRLLSARPRVVGGQKSPAFCHERTAANPEIRRLRRWSRWTKLPTFVRSNVFSQTDKSETPSPHPSIKHLASKTHSTFVILMSSSPGFRRGLCPSGLLTPVT